MKSLFLFLSKYLLFWYLVFFLQRNIFISFFYNTFPFSIKEWFLCNTHSFFIDLSTISYIFLPLLILLLFLFIKKNVDFRKPIKYYTIILLIISNFILISDIGLFAEWGSKINHKAISYLAYPKEALASTKAAPIFILLLLLFFQTIIEILIFNKLVKHNLLIKESNWLKKTVFFILFLGFVFIGIRGGFQTFPIDRSWSYFSEKPLLNQAAVNSTWNCLAALAENDDFESNPYKFMDDKKAGVFFSQLTLKNSDSSANKLFKVAKPNIIIVLLESWGAETIGALNKEIDATPKFTILAKEGLLFTNFYSSGFRTEQALAAIIAGFPSQPKTTIIRKFGKFDKMPSLAKVLASNGYNTSYYYGGDLQFANTEAYLKSSGFKKIIGQNDFNYKLYNEWGAFDEELFNFTVKDLSENKQPFFSIIMTSTSHEPFDKRVKKVYQGGQLVDDYLNVIHYTDECLDNFIEKAKKEPWFQNTIFVMLADHTNRLPKNRQNFEIERHWIPCLIYGDALKDEFKGKTIDRPASHVDIPAIILSQLTLPYEQFKWSKNILGNDSNTWAFYTFDEGLGFIKNNDKIVYDIKLNRLIYKTNNTTDSLATQEGKALLQKLMNDYINLSN